MLKNSPEHDAPFPAWPEDDDILRGLFADVFELPLPGGDRETWVHALAVKGLLSFSKLQYVRCKGPLDKDRFQVRDLVCEGRLYLPFPGRMDEDALRCNQCERLIDPAGKVRYDVLRSRIDHEGVNRFLERIFKAQGLQVKLLPDQRYQVWGQQLTSPRTVLLIRDAQRYDDGFDGGIVIDERHFALLPGRIQQKTLSLIDVIRDPTCLLSFLRALSARRPASRQRSVVLPIGEPPSAGWTQQGGSPLIVILMVEEDRNKCMELDAHLKALRAQREFNWAFVLSLAAARDAMASLAIVSPHSVGNPQWHGIVRGLVEEGNQIVIPIKLTECLMPPFLDGLQAIPQEGFISSFRPRERPTAWVNVVKALVARMHDQEMLLVPALIGPS